MPIDSWLASGFALPDGSECGRPVYSAEEWQIVETDGSGWALLAREKLHAYWINAGLIEDTDFHVVEFGTARIYSFSCGPSQIIEPVSSGRSPSSFNQALSFAVALAQTRQIDQSCALGESIYVERMSKLLPVLPNGRAIQDEILLGTWLSGGVPISCDPVEPLARLLTWLGPNLLRKIIASAGLGELPATVQSTPNGSACNTVRYRATQVDQQVNNFAVDTGAISPSVDSNTEDSKLQEGTPFALPGREALEQFFNEFVVDIVMHRERYHALGIGFPHPIVLHGPPGCGKTFAVEQLANYLGWPRFDIDASSVASPYIHETSRKVSEIFNKAMASSPSILVIDEMDAFLANRDDGAGSGQHHVEEVAEFLRRIPEAAKNEVLVIGMTNRLGAIDPAIMRRGRFDHVIEVGFPSQNEILSLLQTLTHSIPNDANMDLQVVAKELDGRALSDVSFVVREGARLSARAGHAQLQHRFLMHAARINPTDKPSFSRRIGFM